MKTFTPKFKRNIFLLSSLLITNFSISQAQNIWIEAESAADQGTFAPFEVQNDFPGASGDQYVVMPHPGFGDGEIFNWDFVETQEEGFATYNFNLSGTVNIWTRANLAGDTDDSYWVGIDSEEPVKQNGYSTGGWEWIKTMDQITLGAGAHTLSLARREDEAMIDKFLITTNLSFVPTGEGDIANSISDEMTDDAMNLKNVLVYPNPTKGACKIDLGRTENVELQIFNILGSQLISQQYINQRMISLDLASLTAGNYYIKITSGDKSVVKPITLSK
ncbi:T9SS C-terminal target domain-containing protein [Marinilabiliaceae bacterium JC017]|nr:T9SS C-terminal target domain-containing protein [Marinilabiliaceae bacterium JC017]